MRCLTALLSLSVVGSATPTTQGRTDSPKAHVKNGTYEGVDSAEYNQDFFLGILFAQPSGYSLLCVGYGEQSEDCLYLNIVRPASYEHEQLPVGFWTHGGRFSNGGGGDQRYNLSFIVKQLVRIGKPMIGASMNYRQSLWGFLHPNEVVGEGITNLGLRDQRIALQIGAASVGFQLTAHGGCGDNLFRAAILQSGNPIYYGSENGTQRSQMGFEAIVSAVGCYSAWDRIQCLREVPFLTLNATMNGSVGTGSFEPTIDGEFVQIDEGAWMSPMGVNTTKDFRATLSSFLPSSFQEAILKAYPDDLSVDVIASLGDQHPAPPYGAQFRRSASFWGDYYFIASRRETENTWASHSLPSYAYRFNAIPAGVPPEVGAGHYKEIGFCSTTSKGRGTDRI
ncbi:Alpha/Beta hydrolase protein [Aspergillus carlsbadensis]|nr:Alpha/Beta hydrolase protein [Aspergillus carlsbadensis]